MDVPRLALSLVVQRLFVQRLLFLNLPSSRGWLSQGLSLMLATLVAVAAPYSLFGDDDIDYFESHIRPLLVEHCLECHSGSTAEGDLQLDTREGWQAGGENGAAIVPHDPESSRLIAAVRRTDADFAMPPDSPLSDDQIAKLEEWIRRGAPDPRGADQRRVGGLSWNESQSWWSLQPLHSTSSPHFTPGSLGIDSPIDAYLAPIAQELGVEPASLADRRTLLRRLSYDLTGLPPTAAEVEAFRQSNRPDALEREADRLLGSVAYGERWGRHWLDVVRYADTAGENSDHPVAHAWRYRNWVIDAWNADQPVDDFIRWQIAGDLIAAESEQPINETERGGPIVATGYLAIARRFGHDSDADMHLTYEDTIDTFGKSLLGLTLGCARCHAHKYDPISAEDYYALYGIFSSTQFPFTGCEARQLPMNMVPIVDPEVWNQQVAGLSSERQALIDRSTLLAAQIDAQTAPLRDLSRRQLLAQGAIDRAGKTTWGPADSGTELLSNEIEVQAGDWLLFSLGPRGNHGADTTRVEFNVLELDSDQRWSAVEGLLDDFLVSNPNPDPDGSAWAMLDGTNLSLLPETIENHSGSPGLNIWRNGDTPSIFVNSAQQPAAVWTTLPARSFFMHPGPSGPVLLAWIAPRTARVVTQGMIEHVHVEGGDGVDFKVEHLRFDSPEGLSGLAELSAERSQLESRIAEIDRQMPAIPEAFAVQEGTVKDAAVQIKGEPEHPGDVVARRWLEVMGGETLGSESSSGRRELAEKVVPTALPLAARVWVNRLWLHHFGRGIVRTPNDFGTRGEPPTHPELLDRLAEELVRSNSSKLLHRQMVTSHAYRRAGVNDVWLGDRDPHRVSYAQFERRRLSAEELRDSLLYVTEALDLTPGQAHPFTDPTTWSYSQHNPFADSFQTSRRTVYLMTKRNRREPFLALFDGADPSATTPVRQSTTVPTQALFFMNDPFFHERAARLAEISKTMIAAETTPRTKIAPSNNFDADLVARLTSLLRRSLQRVPTDEEKQITSDVISEIASENDPAKVEQAWQAVARIILSSNEFLYLD